MSSIASRRILDGFQHVLLYFFHHAGGTRDVWDLIKDDPSTNQTTPSKDEVVTGHIRGPMSATTEFVWFRIESSRTAWPFCHVSTVHVLSDSIGICLSRVTVHF